MTIYRPMREKIKALKEEFDRLKKGKESLLKLINESELPESVYNSNAIENSTLTLPETEKILLEMEVSKKLSLREVFEAKNLARVMEYISEKHKEEELSEELILRLHQMLIGNINDKIAGRFRQNSEFVRIGSFIAPAPKHLSRMLETAILEYSSNQDNYFLEKISRFHLDFETVHPFIDGNGRIGRVLINFQLQKMDYPVLIIRDKEKTEYYKAFGDYRDNKKTKIMDRLISLALIESLHKRLAYLSGKEIITLVEFAKIVNKPVPAILNAARRQTVPAFREKGVWKIGKE